MVLRSVYPIICTGKGESEKIESSLSDLSTVCTGHSDFYKKGLDTTAKLQLHKHMPSELFSTGTTHPVGVILHSELLKIPRSQG